LEADNKSELLEWAESLKSVARYSGKDQANAVLSRLQQMAADLDLNFAGGVQTAYANSNGLKFDELSSEDVKDLDRLLAVLRWNAMAMVVRGGWSSSELGGHIATYQSIAALFEIGQNYFFHADDSEHGGDLVFYQGHASPGNYARAFIEGFLDKAQLDHFRQEINQPGLSSYPHPWLMPDFWQFPTVSMGLGPYMAIYQAKFLRYLDARGLAKTTGRKVWAFCGDGEMSEPESLGAIGLAGREKLDNLIFVINCNLQRLDGPVWGNGQIIQWFESQFLGAGWKVIKIIWGKGWCDLFAKDKTGKLQQRLSSILDGDLQNFASHGGSYVREKIFSGDADLEALAADLSDSDLAKLQRGGHDYQLVYSAYKTATEHVGQPVLILAHTVKGYGLGEAAEGKNVAHQTKKLKADSLKLLRDNLQLDLSDADAEKAEYIELKNDSSEKQFLEANRKKLGGYTPRRRQKTDVELTVPDLSVFGDELAGSAERELSTTMVFGRILSKLLRVDGLKENIVPILVDESRTFGLEGLFRQIGIYSSVGQNYDPEDKKLLMNYKEAKDGQILQEGINEAGGIASWIAAATSYSNNNVPMVPFYIYYSMFGYQRIGDFVWAAGDMRARGFIIGGTAGRTTLAGEGLQHQDGQNLQMFDGVPNCLAYDPAFGFEMAVIIQDGLRRMYKEQEDVFYYITAMNENYQQLAMPEGAEQGILKGLYKLKSAADASKKVQLIGSGTILQQAILAAELLAEVGVSADIWSAPSFGLLRRDIQDVERHNRLHPEDLRTAYVADCFKDAAGPVIAATDYLKSHADSIRSAISQPYHVLGTDGYGRSDTRAALRDFFEVDAKSIADTALQALYLQGDLELGSWQQARAKWSIKTDAANPITR
jgi:pyruvate dehydrogenase E1 component